MRSSPISSGLRVAANTVFAPLSRASLTSARPIPRFAPVMRTVLFATSIPLWLRGVMDEIPFHPYYGPPPAKDTCNGSATGQRSREPEPRQDGVLEASHGGDPVARQREDVEADSVADTAS